MLRDGVERREAVAKLQTKTEKSLAKLSLNQQNNPFARSAQQVETALNEIAATPTHIITKSWMQGAGINLLAPALMIDKRVRQLPHVSFASDTRGDLFSRVWQFLTGSSTVYVAIIFVSVTGAILVSIIQLAGFFVLLRDNVILAVLCALAVAYFIVLNGPVGSPKYRLPIEPILIICLGSALLPFWEFVRKSFYRRKSS